MPGLLYLLLGVLIGTGGTYLRFRSARKPVNSERVDYKKLWKEAVNLLGFNGQLTPEQVAKITPGPANSKLPRGKGFSSDRRKVEIARAKAGLEPADSLEGMYSSDIAAVHTARIRYGTAK